MLGQPHYAAAPRNDTDYWRDAKTRVVPDGLTERLQRANSHLLDGETIYPQYHGFESYSWNTMLLGLGAGPRRGRPVLDHLDATAARKEFSQVAAEAALMTERLPSCHEYLTSIQPE